MVTCLVPLLFSFFLVYLLIPPVRSWALRKGLVDRPSRRKIHQVPIPLTGGLALYLGIAVTWLLFLGWSPDVIFAAAGGLCLVTIGFVDDWHKARGREFSPWPRLFVQGIVATLVYAWGVRFVGMGTPLGDGFLPFPPWLSYLATLLWLVGITNTINFLDGADGLAGGVTVISGLTLSLIAFVKGQYDTAMMAIALSGGTLAFLRYNFHPASIFMGDAGSTFLGFSLAYLALDGAIKVATLLSITITLLALGVPVFDTLQVIFSRLKRGTPIYLPDRLHVHHRLLAYGLTQRQAVIVIYAISLGLSFLAILLLFLLM